jgi:NADH-quinone oxidoreductase subunit G
MVDRKGEADKILVSADRNPNTHGVQLMGLTESKPVSEISNLSSLIERGEIKVLLTSSECAIKAGIPQSTLQKLSGIISLDILPNQTTELATIVLPGSAHVEKRGTFINGKKIIQRFQQAFTAKGSARPDWEILNELLPSKLRSFSTFEGLFKEMCAQTPSLQEVTWNGLGETGIALTHFEASKKGTPVSA